MSYWQQIKSEDIDISEDGEELEIYVGSDEAGNNYMTIKLEDIFERMLKAFKHE